MVDKIYNKHGGCVKETEHLTFLYIFFNNHCYHKFCSNQHSYKNFFYIFQEKLKGYNFPVYSTERCPGNETEWNQRSSALNCTEKRGYMCFPNQNFTELLEFCYTQPFTHIEAGKQNWQLYKLSSYNSSWLKINIQCSHNTNTS